MGKSILTSAMAGRNFPRRGWAAVAFLVLGSQAWLRPSPLAPRSSRTARAGQADESHDLMEQLAEDMEVLLRKTEEPEAADEPEESEPLEVTEALQKIEPQAQVVSLDVSGLQRAPEYGGDKYIVSVNEIQTIVNEKVKHFSAVIKGLNRYITELEEDLEETEATLEQTSKALQEEGEKRRRAELEAEVQQQKRSELELQLAEAQQAKQEATSLLDNLDQQAEQVAERAASGEISEEESHEIEEKLIRAQARRLLAQQSEEKSHQQLQEVSEAADEASRQAQAASQRQQQLTEEMEKLKNDLLEAQEQRDAEAQLREQADARQLLCFTAIQACVLWAAHFTAWAWCQGLSVFWLQRESETNHFESPLRQTQLQERKEEAPVTWELGVMCHPGPRCRRRSERSNPPLTI
ncbi:unnamed protein product [Effrenium voratum]|uniref:Uncharacterized protein n=1 Tax=Effrenium voratum TaxID=2562239 RepID=A0AA36JJB5_9DINO|nr:unnamed protein product [Effrenium voratum]CAJ1452291.1 unnamed protein product [Effrenium voratum]